MKHLTRTMIAAVAMGAILSVANAFANDLSPIGSWQSAGGESRYEVTLCGDGTKLCARLTWLRADMRTAENLQYLNTYVVRGARSINTNKWQGTINYAGEKIGGSVVLVNANKMRLTGCKLLACQTLDFNRV